MSGYHGTHRTRGKLGAFLALVEARRIAPGSVLIVEAMDRLSRQTPREALSVFLAIVSAGIEVVTLIDGQRYSKKSIDANMGQLFLSIGLMFGAHTESRNKAERVAAAWIKRRGGATSVVPGWFDKTADGVVVRSFAGVAPSAVKALVANEKADVVRRMFRLIGEMGTPEIARALNREGAPCLRGKRWDGATVRRILRGRQVLGEQLICHVVDGKQVATGEVLRDAYPAIVTEAVWRKAQAVLDGRAVPKGRNAERLTNLFGDLARCGVCGARMGVKNSGRTRGDKVYEYHHLVCSGYRTGVCTNRVKHDVRAVEKRMAAVFAHLVPAPANGSRRDPVAPRLVAARQEAAKMQRNLDAMVEGFADAPGSVRAAMLKLADRHKAKLAEIAGLERELAQGEEKRADTGVWRGLEGLEGAELVKARAHVMATLPRIVEGLKFRADGTFGIAMREDWAVLYDGRLIRHDGSRPEPLDMPPKPRPPLPRRRGENPFSYLARGLLRGAPGGL